MNAVLGIFGYLAIAIIGAGVVSLCIGLPVLLGLFWAVNKAFDLLEQRR